MDDDISLTGKIFVFLRYVLDSTDKMRRQCVFKSCNKNVTKVTRHLIGHHLPWFARYNFDHRSEELFGLVWMWQRFLKSLLPFFNADSIADLLDIVKTNKLYPLDYASPNTQKEDIDAGV